ncbi:MAG: arabinose efflux permease family protein [Methanobacterium sp. Maddingley MBC34]|nr:MAG: arabinose efflux permease family protein [Methanobacterium sp. Maddingley MBC34]
MIFMESKLKSGWTVLFVVSLSLFIIGLDSTFMNVAMMYLVKDLNTTLGHVQSIIAIYTLVMGCFVLFGAKLQDVIGRKKTFLTGAIIYGIGTLIAATSTNSTMLLVGWSVIEGFGAAMMLPATSAIVTSTYSGSKRTFALGFTATVFTVSVAIGPLLGGFLTTFYSWRWGFGLEAIVVLFILLFSKSLVESEHPLGWSDINLKGAILSAAGIFIIIIGVLQLNTPSSWLNYSGTIINPAGFAVAMAMIITGVLLLVIFFFYQRRLIRQDKKPFMNIRILKSRPFTLGIVAVLIMSLIQAGVFYLVPLYVQTRWEANALVTGLILLASPLGALIFSLSGSKLTKYIKHNHLVSLGFLVSIIAILMLYTAFINYLDLTMYHLIPGLFILGSGLGLALPHLNNIILSSLKETQYADGSGILSTFNNVGSSIGTVVIGLIFFIAVYFSVVHSLPVEYPQYQNQMALNHDIYSWVDQVIHPNIATISEDHNLLSLTLYSGARGMQFAFLSTAILLFVGFLLSLFIKPPPMD